MLTVIMICVTSGVWKWKYPHWRVHHSSVVFLFRRWLQLGIVFQAWAAEIGA